MKNLIVEVLNRYKGSQFNIDSDAGINIIADEIVDEVESKYTVIDRLHNKSDWATPGELD